jgi:hypothetical protein
MSSQAKRQSPQKKKAAQTRLVTSPMARASRAASAGPTPKQTPRQLPQTMAIVLQVQSYSLIA